MTIQIHSKICERLFLVNEAVAATTLCDFDILNFSEL